MNQKTTYLSGVGAFRDLSSLELEDVEHHTRLVNYGAGHLFYMPDDVGEVLFILKKGRVQLYRMSTDGRKLVVAVLQDGAIFGHMALVGQRLHHTYAQALDDVVICVWHRDEVEALLLRKPEVALYFLEAVGERLHQTEERLTEITFQRIPVRLASLLLRLHAEGDLTGYTHQYLADMLGTYRETITQILNQFRQQGMIELSRKQIRIVDRLMLQSMVDLS